MKLGYHLIITRYDRKRQYLIIYYHRKSFYVSIQYMTWQDNLGGGGGRGESKEEEGQRMKVNQNLN